MGGIHWVFGEAGSGRTTLLLDEARAALAQRQRVWWIGLPNQRNSIYQRITAEGGVLGLEFMSQQQCYYQLLAAARKLKPLLIGTGRIATVGQALQAYNETLQGAQQQAQGSSLPSAGEARLFTRAIAELKRYALTPQALTTQEAFTTGEMARLAAVYAIYERLKGEQWDYDDFRLQTLTHLETREHWSLEPDVIIVDGFRELASTELRIYRALAAHCRLWISLPPLACLPNVIQAQVHAEDPRMVLDAAKPPPRACYRAANPVEESRWLLRALKQDVAQGIPAQELAVILPRQRLKALLALADEYQLPLMNEIPHALADTAAGRVLLDILELPDYPTASRLLAIPELQPLARVALQRHLSGRDALSALAQELGMATTWHQWFEVLDVPEVSLTWVDKTLDLIPEILGETPEKWAMLRELMRARAKEAQQLSREGSSFRAWWAGLLQEHSLFQRPQAGIALLTATLASGRRFRKVYILAANEGNYGSGESEDYFIPEELRQARQPVAAFAEAQASLNAQASSEAFAPVPGLPKKFDGEDAQVHAELRTRAYDQLIVSYPEANQSGPLMPEPGLVEADGVCPPLPLVPAASRLERVAGADVETYQPHDEQLEPQAIRIAGLQRYDTCPFRYWATQRLGLYQPPLWRQLIQSLGAHKTLNEARFGIVHAHKAYYEFASWLEQHREMLLNLHYGEWIVQPGSSPQLSSKVDALQRRGTVLYLYTFTAPSFNVKDAKQYIEDRWADRWAAGRLLQRYPKLSAVQLLVWPVGGEAIAVTTMKRPKCGVDEQVAAAYEHYQTGDVSPRPDFHCRDCQVFDVCRKGQR